jgi:hypothetical protein
MKDPQGLGQRGRIILIDTFWARIEEGLGAQVKTLGILLGTDAIE